MADSLPSESGSHTPLHSEEGTSPKLQRLEEHCRSFERASNILFGASENLALKGTDEDPLVSAAREVAIASRPIVSECRMLQIDGVAIPPSLVQAIFRIYREAMERMRSTFEVNPYTAQFVSIVSEHRDSLEETLR